MFPVLERPIVYSQACLDNGTLVRQRGCLCSPFRHGFPSWPTNSKIVESTSDRPWIVTHIGQGGMVDDRWQSAPGKITAWESGVKKCGYLSRKYGIHQILALGLKA